MFAEPQVPSGSPSGQPSDVGSPGTRGRTEAGFLTWVVAMPGILCLSGVVLALNCGQRSSTGYRSPNGFPSAGRLIQCITGVVARSVLGNRPSRACGTVRPSTRRTTSPCLPGIHIPARTRPRTRRRRFFRTEGPRCPIRDRGSRQSLSCCPCRAMRQKRSCNSGRWHRETRRHCR